MLAPPTPAVALDLATAELAPTPPGETGSSDTRELLRVVVRNSTAQTGQIESDDTRRLANTADNSRPDDSPLLRILNDPAPVASAGITAGVLWWLTRSGGLLTSILMGVPAWRHVDLLPVLAQPTGKGIGGDGSDGDDDDEGDGDDEAADDSQFADFDDHQVADLFDQPAGRSRQGSPA